MATFLLLFLITFCIFIIAAALIIHGRNKAIAKRLRSEGLCCSSVGCSCKKDTLKKSASTKRTSH